MKRTAGKKVARSWISSRSRSTAVTSLPPTLPAASWAKSRQEIDADYLAPGTIANGSHEDARKGAEGGSFVKLGEGLPSLDRPRRPDQSLGASPLRDEPIAI